MVNGQFKRLPPRGPAKAAAGGALKKRLICRFIFDKKTPTDWKKPRFGHQWGA